ncbi:MAG TPA: RNA methyltransferase, partial [Chitinophagaceae bacterium]|nr:RNA methyltransferase [Chitinophagaceae bacterium]
GVGALNEDAVKTSAGALEQIHICRVNSLMIAVDELRLNGISVFASEMTATTKLYNLNLNIPCAIVMGSEEKGVYPALMKICENTFHIPMANNFESLNVSVATGMILYEAMKQRK